MFDPNRGEGPPNWHRYLILDPCIVREGFKSAAPRRGSWGLEPHKREWAVGGGVAADQGSRIRALE